MKLFTELETGAWYRGLGWISRQGTKIFTHPQYWRLCAKCGL